MENGATQLGFERDAYSQMFCSLIQQTNLVVILRPRSCSCALRASAKSLPVAR